MNIATIRNIGTAIVALLVVVVMVTGAATALLDSQITNQTATAEITNGKGELPGVRVVHEVFSAKTSLNDSVRLTGSSTSKVTLSADIKTSGTWSVCAFATADSSVVTNNERRVIVGVGDVVVSYNGTSDSYRAWYYNSSTRTATDVTINAPTPSDRTLVCAQKNGTHLKIARNTSAPSTTPLTSGGASDPPASNWDGTIDELRVWNVDLSSAQRQALYTAPTIGVAGATPAARVAFDARDRTTSSVPVYFDGGTADLSDATLVAGIKGQRLSRGTDYEIENGDTAVVADGSTLSGSGDLIFFDLANTGGFTTLFMKVISIGRSALALLVIGVLLLAANRLQSMIGGGGGL